MYYVSKGNQLSFILIIILFVYVQQMTKTKRPQAKMLWELYTMFIFLDHCVNLRNLIQLLK